MSVQTERLRDMTQCLSILGPEALEWLALELLAGLVVAWVFDPDRRPFQTHYPE